MVDRQPYARRVILACIGLLLLSSAIFLAQDFQLKARVDEVRVPVSVRDDTGALVQGLKKEDFTILESGVPQEILSFSTDPLPISAAIIVDTAITSDQLRRFSLVSGTLMKEFKAIDEFAVYRYDHVVTKLSDYTSNPQNLEKSFDAIRQIADDKPQDSEPGVAVGPSPLRWIIDRTQIGTNGAQGRPDRPSTPISPTSGNSTSMKAPEVSRVLHDAIFAAEVDLEKRPENRRKMILLVSNGEVTGENEHGQGEVVTRLYRNGIQVYAVDPEHKVFNHMTLLNSYTHGTGGAVFEGNAIENMAIAFAQVIEQARDQYMIGYVSNNEPTSNRPVLRNIDVKVKGRKYKIVHRMNYMQYP
ncbi:MAG TPA: VWA domain-containing protein [Terriglobia bacterium]